MSHSLAGLVALNALFLAAGLGLLWGIRGWRSWTELPRLAGIAYLLGVAAVGVLAVELVIAGVSPTVPVVLGVALGVGAAGVLAGALLRRPLPGWRPERVAREPLLWIGLAFAALAGVFLEAFFRVARVQGLLAYDAWAFWTPKAKAIYLFGGLDERLFASLPGPTYPIFVPSLQAIDFHFMGSADTTTLHVQYWFLLAGFVLAVAGLLRPQVRLALIWPFLALALLMPDFDYRVLNPQADWPLDYFFVGAALCAALWILRRERWLLVSFGILLAATMSTKREGQILTASLVVGTLLATARERRFAWPRVVGVAALAFCATLPWRFWVGSRHIGGEWEGASWSSMLHHLDRVPPALRVMLELLFSWDFWFSAAALGVAAGLILLVRRGEALAAFYFGTLACGFAAFTWLFWAVTRYPLDTSDQTPLPRAVGALVLLSLAFAPLMLERAFERRE